MSTPGYQAPVTTVSRCGDERQERSDRRKAGREESGKNSWLTKHRTSWTHKNLEKIVEQQNGLGRGHRADIFGVESETDALRDDVGQRQNVDGESNQGPNESEEQLVDLVVRC